MKLIDLLVLHKKFIRFNKFSKTKCLQVDDDDESLRVKFLIKLIQKEINKLKRLKVSFLVQDQ